jgi:hypothetical protein
MVALSVDELMPLAKEIDPNNNPSYGVLCGMSVMGLKPGIIADSRHWLMRYRLRKYGGALNVNTAENIIHYFVN